MNRANSDRAERLQGPSLTHLINNVANMVRKPVIESDLSGVLDEFLGMIEASGDCPGSRINFVEAAILIQNAAELYGKKVDLLWDYLFECNRRLILTDVSANETEIQELEVRKRKYKRRTRAHADDVQTASLLKKFSWGNSTEFDYLNQVYEPGISWNEWHKYEKFLNEESYQLQLATHNVFLPKDPVYTDENDYIGRYDQFHSASVMNDIFHIEDDYETLESTGSHINDLGNLTNLPLIAKDESFNRRSSSLVDSVLEDDCLSSVSQSHRQCDSPSTTITNTNSPLSPVCEEQNPCAPKDKRNISCSQDSAFFDCGVSDVTLRTEHTNPSIVVTTVVKQRKESTLPLISTRKTQRKSWGVILEMDEEPKGGKRRKVATRLSPKKMLQLATGITAGYVQFENFCRRLYEPTEGEGEVPPLLEETQDLVPEDNTTDTNEDDALSVPELTEEGSYLRDEPSEEVPEEEPLPHTSSFKITDLPELSTCTTNDSSRQNVREWRNYIAPKLKSLDTTSDFDIHEYGANIINSVDVGSTIFFKDVVGDKTQAEIARYFNATLQLANTYNVEISGVKPGEYSNDTLQLTVKDKTKHHELLNGYTAPSEESFRKHISKFSNSSTPQPGPSAKKSRLEPSTSKWPC